MKGRKVELAPSAEPRQAEVIDLMERLRQSLAKTGASRRASRGPLRRKRA
jgi:non-homologous end joining protein Ku